MTTEGALRMASEITGRAALRSSDGEVCQCFYCGRVWRAGQPEKHEQACIVILARDVLAAGECPGPWRSEG